MTHICLTMWVIIELSSLLWCWERPNYTLMTFAVGLQLSPVENHNLSCSTVVLDSTSLIQTRAKEVYLINDKLFV